MRVNVYSIHRYINLGLTNNSQGNVVGECQTSLLVVLVVLGALLLEVTDQGNETALDRVVDITLGLGDHETREELLLHEESNFARGYFTTEIALNCLLLHKLAVKERGVSLLVVVQDGESSNTVDVGNLGTLGVINLHIMS